MAEKAGFNAATGFSGGATIGINADSWPEFIQLCESVWPGEGLQVAQGLYANLRAQARPVSLTGEQQAVGQLQQQLGAVPASDINVPPMPQNGPPPQWGGPPAPAVWGGQQQAQNGPPPGQTCDPKDPTKTVWVPPGVSKKTGRPYAGFWSTPR